MRFPVIVLPELARRTLGEGPLCEAFLTAEAADESILSPGSYPASHSGVEPVGEVVGDPDEALGSNNWVVSGNRSVSGAYLCWQATLTSPSTPSPAGYEVHLRSAGFNVAGAGYIGVPGIILGRNKRLAWGITNNICSQLDLYQEKLDPDRPGHFFYDGKWEAARRIRERIEIKNGDSVDLTVLCSRNGPVVTDLLPSIARDTGPVSLRWLGTTFCDEIPCLLEANRADTCHQFRKALRAWRVPTLSVVFADVDGHIDYQAVGRIPIRKGWQRGYRKGWEPEDQWQSLIPFEGMPALAQPPEGWIRTANNRAAPEDYPYPLSGTWLTGYRALRIRRMIEEKPKLSLDDLARMQMDTHSIRAEEAVPHLLRLLGQVEKADLRVALDYLESWNRRMDPQEVGAAIFEVFFGKWEHAVASQRFAGDMVAPMAGALAGLSVELLVRDRSGWFATVDRGQIALEAFQETLQELGDQLGPDVSGWTWGRIHTVVLAHCLSNLGDLGTLLDRGGQPVGGSGVTVCNTGFDPTHLASMGANYRLIAQLDDGPAVLWSVDASGQSGNPGSSHCGDQLPEWLASRRHAIPLDPFAGDASPRSRLVLRPQDAFP